MLKTPELRLETCSRWPEKAGCGQECLKQVEAAPEGCLVTNILVDWCKGKVCCSCGMKIGEISLAGARPALLDAGGNSMEWREVPAEKLLETLQAAQPICFACHTARKMLREHTGLVSGLSEATGRPVH